MELFWDILSPGEFYIVEDLLCGPYGEYPSFPPKVLDAQPFYEYVHDRVKTLRARNNVNDANFDNEGWPSRYAQVDKIEHELDMCAFVPGAIIIRKKP